MSNKYLQKWIEDNLLNQDEIHIFCDDYDRTAINQIQNLQQKNKDLVDLCERLISFSEEVRNSGHVNCNCRWCKTEINKIIDFKQKLKELK